MKDIKNELKQEFNKIDISEETTKDIRNNIVIKYNKRKKRIVGSSLIVLLIILGVIVLNIPPKNNQLENIPKEENKEISYEEGKNVIVVPSTTPTTDKLLAEDFPTLVKNSDAVIEGRVSKVEYESINGNAWTKLLVTVDEVLIGKINEKDVVVYYLGGYITLDEHIKYYDDAERFNDIDEEKRKNTILKEYVDGEEEFVKVGQELVLCLVDNKDIDFFPKDSYQRLYAAGMLKLVNGKYTQLYGEIDNKYSISKDKVDNIKKIKEN